MQSRHDIYELIHKALRARLSRTLVTTGKDKSAKENNDASQESL